MVRYLGSTIVLEGRGLLLPVRRALRGGRRRGEPEGRPVVRPDRPRRLAHTNRKEQFDGRFHPHSCPRNDRDASEPIVGLLAVVAVAAAAITWAVYDVTMNGDGGSAPKVVSPDPLIQSDPSFMKSISALGAGAAGLRHRGRRPSRRTRGVTAMPPSRSTRGSAIRTEHQRDLAGTAEGGRADRSRAQMRRTGSTSWRSRHRLPAGRLQQADDLGGRNGRARRRGGPPVSHGSFKGRVLHGP